LFYDAPELDPVSRRRSGVGKYTRRRTHGLLGMRAAGAARFSTPPA
jgi:hypothetical protein